MSHDKSKVVDVFRDHFAHCFDYVEYSGDKSKSSTSQNVPLVDAAKTNANWQRVTIYVEDVSIRMNRYVTTGRNASGRDLVNFILSEVNRAFAHSNIHTYVLVADMTCFGVEAKGEIQAQRQKKAENEAKKLGLKPYAWDINNPHQIVDLNRPIPQLIAMQASSGVMRRVVFEVMMLIQTMFTPPNGKRLILHYEPMHHTNPAVADDFMPRDISTGIALCKDRLDVIEAARAEITELESKLSKTEFREAARQKTIELARSGCFYTVPICIETTQSGLTYKPFALHRMKFQSGEADLAIPRYVSYLYMGSLEHRLAGERELVDTAHEKFYTPQQRQDMAVLRQFENRQEIYVGEKGSEHPQCTCVASTDSDFLMLLVYTFAMLIANYDAKRSATDPTGYEVYAPYAPILLRGIVHTKTRHALKPGEYRTYFAATTKDQSIVVSHELFLAARMYEALVFGHGNGVTNSPTPLSIVLQNTSDRMEIAGKKRAATAAAKKAAIASGMSAEDFTKRRKLEAAAKKANADDDDNDEEDEDDQSGDCPVICVPPLAKNASDDAKFERVASFVMMTVALGNDYLAGFRGVNRRWAYAAYVEMLLRDPSASLVRTVRQSGVNDVMMSEARPNAPAQQIVLGAPSLPLIIDVVVHERFMTMAYYMNLMAQPCKTNKPTIPVEQLSLDQIAQAVTNKFPNKTSKHMPDAATRERMQIRLLWVLRYFTSGSSTIRNIFDPLKFGWEGKWAKLIV